MARTTEFEKSIMEMIEGKKYKALKETISTINPYDLAMLLGELSEKNILLLYRLLPKDLAADTFIEMDIDHHSHFHRDISLIPHNTLLR